MEKKQIIMSIVVLIIVAVLSFYAGTKTNSGKNMGAGSYMMNQGNFNKEGNSDKRGSNGDRANQFTTRGLGNGVNMASGEIINKDENSLTIKLRDGGSKIIFINKDTKIQKISDGTLSDLSVGSQITISGQTNTDGSVNASSIQQRPEMMQRVQ